MRKFFSINRLILFTKEFGFFHGSISLVKWIYEKNIYKYYAKKVTNIEMKYFSVKKNSNFYSLYTGNTNEEVYRIINGERKILFYNKDDENIKYDIKYRWECNRMQHLPILALSEKKDFLYKELNNNLDYIFQDTNSMEIAITAINALTAVQTVGDKIDNNIKKKVEIFLHNCLKYILSNIELGIGYSNNHYFFNLIGVIWIIENICGNKTTMRIKKIAYHKLANLLKKMINSDGSLYEGSTSYHKYVTDTLIIFLYYNSITNKKIVSVAERMFKFCNYASINNRLVNIGDNDSGRLLPLPEYFNYSSCDILYTNKIAEKLKLNEYNKFDESVINRINISGKSSFGIFKMHNYNWKLIIRCDQYNNPAKKVIGTHYHNDQLSIIAYYKNISIFIDTGVYSYIQKNNYRLHNLKTISHNTIIVNDLEQNIIHNDWSYSGRQANGKVIRYQNDLFEGEFTSYKYYIHNREIDINNRLIIKDTIEIKKPDDTTVIKVLFHLNPDIEPIVIEKNHILLRLNGTDFLNMIISNNSNVVIKPSIYSPEYGEYIHTNVVVIYYETSKKESIITINTVVK